MGQETDDRRGDAFLVSVARAAQVLERLAEAGSLSLSDVARDLGVNKNIAHRLLFTLADLGFIHEDGATRRYQLTYKLLNLARTQWISTDALAQSEPILNQLARDTGELVRLALVERGELRWVFARTGAKRSLMIDPAYGGNIIPHVHATSKAYLMTLPPGDLDAHIARMTFAAYSPHTITDPDVFRENLREAQACGFACSYEERDLGVAAVAAPVFAGGRQSGASCVAVVSVSAPASRLDRGQINALARERLVPAARRLQSMWPL